MGMEEEPEKLGVSAEIEILKNEISCEKPAHDMLMPCTLGTVVRDARRIERSRREGEEAAQEKAPVDSVEFWHTLSLANASPQVPSPWLSHGIDGSC